jgi:hypothetical protein
MTNPSEKRPRLKALHNMLPKWIEVSTLHLNNQVWSAGTRQPAHDLKKNVFNVVGVVRGSVNN